MFVVAELKVMAEGPRGMKNTDRVMRDVLNSEGFKNVIRQYLSEAGFDPELVTGVGVRTWQQNPEHDPKTPKKVHMLDGTLTPGEEPDLLCGLNKREPFVSMAKNTKSGRIKFKWSAMRRYVTCYSCLDKLDKIEREEQAKKEGGDVQQL